MDGRRKGIHGFSYTIQHFDALMKYSSFPFAKEKFSWKVFLKVVQDPWKDIYTMHHLATLNNNNNNNKDNRDHKPSSQASGIALFFLKKLHEALFFQQKLEENAG